MDGAWSFSGARREDISINSHAHAHATIDHENKQKMPSEGAAPGSTAAGRKASNRMTQVWIDPCDGVEDADEMEKATNRICTTHYTLFTFVPKNLWEQFQR